MQAGSYHSRGGGNKTTILPPNIVAYSAEQVPFFPPPVKTTLTRPASGLCSASVSLGKRENLSLEERNLISFRKHVRYHCVILIVMIVRGRVDVCN